LRKTDQEEEMGEKEMKKEKGHGGRRGSYILFLAAMWGLLFPGSTLAHHGGVSLGYGPGSPVEAFSSLTLPEGGVFTMARVEQVEYRKYHWAEPENKDAFTFYTLGLGYGIKPYLTGFLFLPYTIKTQDHLGTSYGGGDAKFLFSLGGNYDPNKGFGLNRAEDTAITFEATKKTYFALILGSSVPTGESHNEDRFGEEFERGMQPGFRSPTLTVGASVTRSLFHGFTVVGDVLYDVFFKKDDFKFGNEFRIDLAGIYDIYTKPGVSALEAVLELNLLHVAKDEDEAAGGKVPNSGGTILYLSPGLRYNFPPFSLALLLKFPVAKDLNRQSEQQGAEGLESFRGVLAISAFF
jgi:hypothetical protein